MTPAPEELAAHALDNEEGRLKVAQIYNQVCRFSVLNPDSLDSSLPKSDFFPPLKK
jgi:hypothetical protein